MSIKNAVIKSTSLSIAEHGVLMAWLHLDYGNLSQAFGGFVLASSNPEHKQGTYCGKYLVRCLEIAGADTWEKLPGRAIRVQCSNEKIVAIGHYLNDDWFNPTELSLEELT